MTTGDETPPCVCHGDFPDAACPSHGIVAALAEIFAADRQQMDAEDER